MFNYHIFSINAVMMPSQNHSLKVCSGRARRSLFFVCELCFLAEIQHRSTVKQVFFFVCDMQNSPTKIIGVLDLNRPLHFKKAYTIGVVSQIGILVIFFVILGYCLSQIKSKSKSKILYLFSGFGTINTSLGLLSEITGN